MRKIINGKRYNTATATNVCDVSPSGYFSNDFRWEDTYLYRTSRGNWFLAGKGGPLTRWAQKSGDTGRCSGSGIIPIDADEARSLLEQHGLSGQVEEYFGETLEDA